MDRGLKESMWAPISSSRRTYDLDRHETRSRSLPPPISLIASTSGTSGSSPGQNTTATTNIAQPSTPSARGTKAGSLARLQSFHRFEQTCHRLRWKFIDLESSYNRALAPADWGFTPADAERNFKVDFHEFYAWIEQAIVFLLLVFGVTVQKGGSSREETRATGWSNHAYHHNVLKALDEEGNPLNGTLGTGDVNQALWKAKELRNRWKDAAEGRETPPLKMYDLRWIVTQILRGLEEAYMLAGREIEGDLVNGEDEGMVVEDGWEWMVESMDWEA